MKKLVNKTAKKDQWGIKITTDRISSRQYRNLSNFILLFGTRFNFRVCEISWDLSTRFADNTEARATEIAERIIKTVNKRKLDCFVAITKNNKPESIFCSYVAANKNSNNDLNEAI